MKTIDKLLTVEQVADKLTCSDTTVYDHMNAGRLAYVNVGGRKGRRVDPDDLRAFIDRQRVETTTPRKLKYL